MGGRYICQPSAAKWNILGSNDSSFNDGTGIADDAITASHIDWASTGADAGIWWEEIGRTTLGSAGDTITVSSLPERKYLKVLVNVIATGGNLDTDLTLNSDTGNNYAHRYQSAGSLDTSGTSVDDIPLEAGQTDSGQMSSTEILIYNVATQEKNIYWSNISQDASGAGTLPTVLRGVGKWANTSDAVDEITITNGGTGDFAIGSEMVVLGHN